MHSGATKLPGRVSALAVALCLLIAPLCAANCSLSSCILRTTPAQSASGCHHHSAIRQDTSTLAADSAVSCQTADSLFDALPIQSPRLLAPINSSANHVQFVSTATQSSPSIADIDFFPISLPGSSPGIPPSALSNSPLRI